MFPYTTTGDVGMCMLLASSDPNVLNWDISWRDYELDASGNLVAEYHVALDRVLALLPL